MEPSDDPVRNSADAAEGEEGWKDGAIEIHTLQGVELMIGQVSPPWGIVERADGRWSVTHLPSGLMAALAANEKDAKSAVTAIRGAVPDAEWLPFDNYTRAGRRAIGKRVRAALNARLLGHLLDLRDGALLPARFRRLNGYSR